MISGTEMLNSTKSMRSSLKLFHSSCSNFTSFVILAFIQGLTLVMSGQTHWKCSASWLPIFHCLLASQSMLSTGRTTLHRRTGELWSSATFTPSLTFILGWVSTFLTALWWSSDTLSYMLSRAPSASSPVFSSKRIARMSWASSTSSQWTSCHNVWLTRKWK